MTVLKHENIFLIDEAQVGEIPEGKECRYNLNDRTYYALIWLSERFMPALFLNNEGMRKKVRSKLKPVSEDGAQRCVDKLKEVGISLRS